MTGQRFYLMRNGELVNRFRQSPGWSPRHIVWADKWIAEHGDALRRQNADLLNPGAMSDV